MAIPRTPLTNITLFPPNSDDPALASSSIPYPAMLGTWHVIASTLPLWSDKKNVTISYTAIPNQPITTYDDLVSYNKLTDKVGLKPTVIKGIDTIEDKQGTGGRWIWRGKGLLKLITSHWQLLGYNLPSPPSPLAEPEFILTYFASTLFTPSGLDIYSRTKDGLSDEDVERIIEKTKLLGGEVERLCKEGKGMFRVPHDP